MISLQVLWFSVAKVSASAHASNTNVQDLISPVWTKLLDTHQKCPNVRNIFFVAYLPRPIFAITVEFIFFAFLPAFLFVFFLFLFLFYFVSF